MTFFPDVAHSHRLSFSWLHSIVWICFCVHSAYRHSAVSSLGRWWIALLWTFQCVHACRTYTGEGLPGLRCFQLLELLPPRFSKWLYQLTFLSAVFDGCSTCSSELAIDRLSFLCVLFEDVNYLLACKKQQAVHLPSVMWDPQAKGRKIELPWPRLGRML